MHNALKYGVLMTLVDSAWMVIQDRWNVGGLAGVLIPFAIILGGLYLGITQRRDEELGGSIAFADACLAGLYITIVFVALDGTATYGYLVLVRPPTNPLRIVMLLSLLIQLGAGTLASVLLGVLLKRPPQYQTAASPVQARLPAPGGRGPQGGPPMAEPGGGPIDPMAEMTGLWGGRPAGPAAPVLPSAPAAVAEPLTAPGRQPSFHGSGGTLFRIWIVNALKTIITLGIYRFWAKTNIRRYFASETEFEGDRFAYHGTGTELLVGAVKAAMVFAVPFALLNVIPRLRFGTPVTVAAVLFGAVYILVLIPLAIVGSRRYRLSRTSWRGIRFSFRGPAGQFVRLFLAGSVLSVLTLGIYYPFFAARRQGFLVSHAYFGTARFGFDGQGRDLLKMYAWAVLLAYPTLGLYSFWFQARQQRYLWGHTSFETARFRSTVTGGALFRLRLVNALLLMGTLGLAAPWVSIRNLRFAFRYLALDGPLDLARIEQEAQAATATGEALAGFLDTGFEFEW